MAKKNPDPNSDIDNDTQPLGDHSPRFRKLTADEELSLLTSAVTPTLADHALDGAAENSKIVVVRRNDGIAGRLAVLATPDGPMPLPEGDAAHLLPEGTKIYKTDKGYFAAILPPEYAEAMPAVGTCARAADVIAAINSNITGPKDG